VLQREVVLEADVEAGAAQRVLRGEATGGVGTEGNRRGHQAGDFAGARVVGLVPV